MTRDGLQNHCCLLVITRYTDSNKVTKKSTVGMRSSSDAAVGAPINDTDDSAKVVDRVDNGSNGNAVIIARRCGGIWCGGNAHIDALFA